MADRYATATQLLFEVVEWNRMIDRDDKGPQRASEGSKEKDRPTKKFKRKSKSKK